MRSLPRIGRAELEILRHITDHAPISVGAVAEHFTQKRGLVRTTVLNVMERLRKKGYLTRKEVAGVYQYSPRQPKGELLKGLVRDFVENSLGGSISPFMAYLAEGRPLDKDEVAELRKIVRELKDTPHE
ncbi:MAG: BlaI/MecI/CopY family transcriptional regulator [Verrucomicrobiales bacterium]|nr:BlaI/MecI/CopY family transcriptional regulator [Verrucomicrobiales bacterium]